MRRLLFLVAAGLAVWLMMLVQGGQFASDDVFFVMQQVQKGAKPEEALEIVADQNELITDLYEEGMDARIRGLYPLMYDDKPRLDQAYRFYDGEMKPFENVVKGSTLSPNMDRLEILVKYFERLAETQTVDTFVILGGNENYRGRHPIAVSEYSFDTIYGEVRPDFELMDELISAGAAGTSYGAMAQEWSIHAYMPFIKKSFPEAKVVAVAIKDFADGDELRNLTRALSNLSGEKNIVVLSSSAFERKRGDSPSYELLNQFHDELHLTILENVDILGVDQAVTDYKKPLQALLDYLALEGAYISDQLDGYSTDQLTNYYFNYSEGIPVGQDRKVTALAVGDMMLGRHVRVLMDIYGLDYPFRNIRGEDNFFFEGADIIHGNLEGPIKGAGKKGGTSMNFAFNEDVAPLLAQHGFTMLSISNNHAVDAGWDGRQTTIDALEGAGLDWCGHPSEPEAESVYYSYAGGKKVAFICLHDVTYTLDDYAAAELIRKVRPEVDYLFVSIHWGPEYQHQPHPTLQVEPAHAFIDAGADFIIGHHPHVVQSFEIYKDKFIFYSLGNFVFDQYWSRATQEQLAIGIVLGEQQAKVYLFPMKSVQAQSRLMNAAEYDEWIERFINYGNYSDEMKAMIMSGIVLN